MRYFLETTQTIKMPKSAENTIAEEILSNYTFGRKWNIEYTNDNCITIGNYKKADFGEGEGVINITDEGVYIGGRDYPGLMHGFFSFLERIKYSSDDDRFYVETSCVSLKPKLDFRCVHLCVFPETKLEFLRKCVRSCAIAKYSHIILEFWGMLKFDCMTELSWPFAYSKEQIKEIVKEANGLGLEIIPMFNHIGHASSCREINGKHVVLDQAPQYEYMFESYGWVWKIERCDVRELLKNIRNELIEVCGEGKYFHIGCDEVYAFRTDSQKAGQMAEYVNEIAIELKTKGRRVIMWHDMMLAKNEFKDYVSMSNETVSDLLLNRLDKSIIIADWQYSYHGETWKTSEKFKDNKFEVVCCPWDNSRNINEAINTAASNNLKGIIHTTWHTLYRGFRELIYAGVVSYGTDNENLGDILRFYCASVARKALPAHGKYEECGWSEKMIGPGLE